MNLEKNSNGPLDLDKDVKKGDNLNLDKGGAAQSKPDISKSGKPSAPALDLHKVPTQAPRPDLGKSVPAAQTPNSGKSGKRAVSVAEKTISPNVTGGRANTGRAGADVRGSAGGTSVAPSAAASAKQSGGAKKRSRAVVYVRVGVFAVAAAVAAVLAFLPNKNFEADYAKQSDGSYVFTSAGTIDAGDKQVSAPVGTVVSKSGVATIPEGKTATYSTENNVTVEIPSGSTVTKDGDISAPSSGEITLDCSSANIPGDGDIVISIPTFDRDSDGAALVVSRVGENGAIVPVKATADSAESAVVIKNAKPQKYIVKLGNKDYIIKGGESAEAAFFADAGILSNLITGREVDVSRTLGRDAAVAVILQAFGIPPKTSFSVLQFDDMNGEYSDYIHTAREFGLVLGVGENNFAPSNALKYEELYKVLANCIDNGDVKLPYDTGEHSAATFTDYAEIPDWANSAIDQLIFNGVISRSDGKLGIGEDVSLKALCQQLYLFAY